MCELHSNLKKENEEIVSAKLQLEERLSTTKKTLVECQEKLEKAKNTRRLMNNGKDMLDNILSMVIHNIMVLDITEKHWESQEI